MMSSTPAPASHRTTSERAETTDAVLAALRAHAPATVATLTQVTGYSRPTVSAIIEDLRAAELVEETSTDQRAGRPAAAWQLRQDAGIVLATDLLAASMLTTVSTLGGHVLAARYSSLSPALSAEQRLETVIAQIRFLAEEYSGYGSLLSLGVSVTGVVDGEGMIQDTDYVPVWQHMPLASRLREALGVEVQVENDINMAAYGEFTVRQQDGSLGSHSDLLLLQFTRGPRTGLILGGKVRRGQSWRAGEVSDLIDLHPDAVPTSEWVDRTALAIASVTAVIDLETIVIASPSPVARETTQEILRRLERLSSRRRSALRIEHAALGPAASVIGALHAALAVANRQVTKATSPRPTVLSGTAVIDQALEGTPHSVASLVTSTRHSDTLRIGVVGVGARSRLALAGERPENNGVITAVCDPHPLATQRVRDMLRRGPESVTITATVEDLTKTGVDVAFVTSPDDTHASATTALLEAGIPVYLEKPLAIDLPGATHILRTAYRTGTKLYVGHNMRHMNVVRSMRDLIRSGRIGQVKAIWCRHFVGNGGDYYFKDWHAERAHVGSLLLQKAAHDIDVMHWLAGSYTTDVVAMGGLTLYDQVTERADNSSRLMTDWFSLDTWPPLSQHGLNPVIDVEDLSMMLMRMDSGVYASYQQCHYTPDYWRNYTVIGTEGRLENHGDGEGGVIRLWDSRTTYSPDGDASFPIMGDAGGHSDADVLTVGEFFRFVRDDAVTDTSPLGAWHAVAAGIQATDSLRHGSEPRRVPSLPPELVAYFQANQRRTP